MNQVTFSADKENLLFIFGDQLIKYPLREGVVVSFIEGQPVVVQAKMTAPQPQFQASLDGEDKVVDLVLDNKNSKGYLVGELDVVIGFQEPEGLTTEEKEVNGAVKSFNFDTGSSKMYIKREGNDLAITMLELKSSEASE